MPRLPLETFRIEQIYQITLTGKEKQLLSAANNLLSALDQQRAFVLTRDLQPITCPACLGTTCRRAAEPDSHDHDSDDPFPDNEHICPLCSARLVWHLGLVGADQWFTLLPGQAVIIGEGPVELPEA